MLSARQKKFLKGQSHSLKPVVIVGAQGLTEGVHQEIERALNDHELIKIKIASKERDYRKEVADAIITHHNAEKINSIGQMVIIYRESDSA